MPTPSTGAITFSQIAQIVKANSTTTISLNETDVRTLLGASSGQISMSSAYSKPVAGTSTYTTPGSYTFIVPAYQFLSTNVSGGGAGGRQGASQEVVCTCFCCGWFCCGLGCTGNCDGNFGAAGGASSFNGVVANGGTSSAAGSGSGGTVTVGGANNGGAGGPGWSRNGNCPGAAGSAGGAGGFVTANWTKAVNGPAYGASLAVTVGAGGAGGSGACGNGGTGGNGGAGSVGIAWL